MVIKALSQKLYKKDGVPAGFFLKQELPEIPPRQFLLFTFNPNAEAANRWYSSLLHLRRSLAGIPESLDGPGVRLPLLLDGFLQNHILDLYGFALLASANISQTVPFVKAFPPLFSQLVPMLTSSPTLEAVKIR